MRELIANPHRGRGPATIPGLPDEPVSTDIEAARALFSQCPASAETSLSAMPDLAAAVGVARIDLKDERNRMGLGSFKALGAAYAIAKMAMARALSSRSSRDRLATRSSNVRWSVAPSSRVSAIASSTPAVCHPGNDVCQSRAEARRVVP